MSACDGCVLEHSKDSPISILSLTRFRHFVPQEAAKFEKKVLVLDFVTPTPLGTRWGELQRHRTCSLLEACPVPWRECADS